MVWFECALAHITQVLFSNTKHQPKTKTGARLEHPVSSNMKFETIELCGFIGTKPKKGKNCQSLALIYDKTKVFAKLDMISTSWTEKGAVFAVLKKKTSTSSCEHFETCYGEQMVLMGRFSLSLFFHSSVIQQHILNRYTRREKSEETTKSMVRNDDAFDMYEFSSCVSKERAHLRFDPRTISK